MASSNRIKKIRNILVEKNIDALLIADDKNIFYFTEFPWGFRLLIPAEGENILFVPSVNYEAAKEKSRNVRVELIKIGEKAINKIFSEISRRKIKFLGFDRLSATEYLKIKSKLQDLELKSLQEDIWSLRKIKDESELALIKKAAELTSQGMKRALEVIKPGLIEREAIAEIEYEMRKRGSSGVAFETIVCSGPESAYPHGGLGEREIKDGDFVVVDLGAKYRGYCADMTRTLIVGEPSKRQLHIYKAVKEAQKIAISRIRSNIKAREVDQVARKYIEEKGYGKYFVHSLGHGVGLDVHEPPTLGPLSDEILSSGNVVTVEPGIYIPGFGGVRIEDTVLIHENKAIKLTDIGN